MFRLPAEASEPEFVVLFDYWRRKAPPGKLPGRQHIDPTELPARILARVLLLDVERADGQPRFRFRIASTALGDLVGREITGLYIDEIGPAERIAPVIAALRTIVDTRQPVFLADPPIVAPTKHVRVKRLGLPLARNGVDVDMVLASFVTI